MRSTDWDKVAEDYFEHIQSPFLKGVKNPLYRMLGRIKDPSKKSVIEIGCGTGILIPYLAKKFKGVVAIDISKKMVKIAKKKNKKFRNVEFKVMDALNVSKLKRKFDVVVTVNGIVMPNIQKINKVIQRARKILKRGGKFVGIFPSADAVIYHALIAYDFEYKKLGKRKRARLRASRRVSRKKQDFCYGIFDYGGKQKWFYKSELEYRFKKAGFKNIRIRKVKYPWSLSMEKKPEIFESDVYEELWDWAVRAEK